MENLILVKTLSQLEDLCNYLEDKDFIAFDTETNGTDKESKIIGMSVSSEVDTGYYIVINYWDKESSSLVQLETESGIENFLHLLSLKNLIMHNAPFDCFMVKNNYGVELMPSVHTDTMILGHILDENRSNGLKELATTIFGEDSRHEQTLMKESVHKNGGVLTKKKYELYKGDADLIGKYGAKDTILTLKLFYHLVPQLYEQNLDKFFYEEESMPLLKGPTYELNSTGLRIDPDRLQQVKGELEAECLSAKSLIFSEIAPAIKDKYPGTHKSNTFNIGAPQQIAWLAFHKLGEEFTVLTDSGKELCKALEFKLPYAPAAKREFIRLCISNKGRVYQAGKLDKKTGKMSRPKKVGDPWIYMSSGKRSIGKLARKYVWAQKLLEYTASTKLLNTYIKGISERLQYNVIRPSFFQHGTTSGRYSSREPNFQNLPRKDKRVKSFVVSRPGKVFVGADYSQLEPRVFASVSKDETLLSCFKEGKDFYSVVGMPIFEKTDCTAFKEDKDSFANKYSSLRDAAKAFALATPYGTSAFQQSQSLDRPADECQLIMDKYFEAYPKVELMMLESHEQAKANGVVHSLYGRPRRIPEAKDIKEIYGSASHGELPYSARTLLNLAMNHRVQSSAASIMNRAAIAFYKECHTRNIECRIVCQIHDELVAECQERNAEEVAQIMKQAMEKTTILPGVDLIAEPKIAKNFADLK